MWEGAVVGIMAMFIYSTFNPYNLGMFPPLPLILAQLFCMATVGAAGGLVCRLRPLTPERVSTYFLMALLAIVLTLLYDFITTLSTAYLFGALIPTLIAGIPFTLVSLVSNTIAFIVLAPLLPVLQARLMTGEW
jgi:hypothetical protein